MQDILLLPQMLVMREVKGATSSSHFLRPPDLVMEGPPDVGHLAGSTNDYFILGTSECWEGVSNNSLQCDFCWNLHRLCAVSISAVGSGTGILGA